MKKKFLLLVPILFASLFCFSQTQSELNLQAQKDYKKADLIMAAKYKLAMAKQDAEGKKLLLEVQRAWIKYKESHCKMDSNQYEGGSMQPLVYFSCLQELTEERTKKLEIFLVEH